MVPDAKGERPGTVAREAVKPYWRAVNIYDGPLTFLRGFEMLPKVVRYLLPILWCDSEVCNGGFHQFFWNSTGVLAPEAAEGYRAVGLAEIADIVEWAVSLLQEPYPRDKATRQAALRALARPGESRRERDPFYELDERYYAAKRMSKLYEYLDSYVRQNA